MTQVGRFRKKSVVVEAVRWMGTDSSVSVDDLRAWGVRIEPTGNWGRDWTLIVWVEPEQSWVTCPVGYWIIKGIVGEFYPCHPSIFEQTYEPELA